MAKIGATKTKPQLRLSAQNARSVTMSARHMAKLTSAMSAPYAKAGIGAAPMSLKPRASQWKGALNPTLFNSAIGPREIHKHRHRASNLHATRL
jgi:hypothetical protein